MNGTNPRIRKGDHENLVNVTPQRSRKIFTTSSGSSSIAVDHTCWPGMVHGLASLARRARRSKVLIDQTGAALRKHIEPA